VSNRERILFVAYAASVAAWNLARLTPLGRWGPFEFADLIGWALLLPLPFLLAVGVLLRRWQLVPVLLVPLLILGVEYGPQLAPQRVPSGRPLRVATANLHYRNPEPEALAKALRTLDADVIAVQELTVDTSRRLVRELAGEYRNRVLYPRTDSEGLGVFSRFPLERLHPPELGVGSCRCQTVNIQGGGISATLFNIHLPRPVLGIRRFDASRQAGTVDVLVREAHDAPYPALLVGDFNVGDRHYLYRRLRAGLGDAHRDAGWGLGLTWSLQNRVPFARIDYVLHDESWGTRSISRQAIPGSDHRALVAELVLD
jgi:endonuclease/exonuclease/phosphatase (EEP) superfamily protein YafD